MKVSLCQGHAGQTYGSLELPEVLNNTGKLMEYICQYVFYKGNF